MKAFWKSKMMWLGFVTGFLGLVQATLEQAPLDPQVSGMVLSGIGALIVFLRAITTQAVGAGDSE